jgi:hypothetical protein
VSIFLAHRFHTVPDPTFVYAAAPRRSQVVGAMAAPALPAPPGAFVDVPSPAQLGQSLINAADPFNDDAACDVCPHAVFSHDAIGLRFCRATLNGAITRGCVCRSS